MTLPARSAGQPKTIEGSLVAPAGARFVVVASRFNSFIVDRLLEGAIDGLVRHGADAANITVVRVPGAWELPLVVQRVSDKKKVDAVLALGAVIRGATPHFDYVAGQAASGVQSAQIASGVPVVFGVLTTDTIEQAIERAGSKSGNKGWDAATTAVEMVSLAAALKDAGF